jgi:calcineurin-like phosphoesterase family protein
MFGITVEYAISVDKINTWLISDTHFDHENIIKYCNRPFITVTEMNNKLLNNWNNTINDDDNVFFLGDMAFGRNSKSARWWLTQLKGNKIFIKGSHDKGIRSTSIIDKKTVVVDNYFLTKINDLSILLIHNPINVPAWHYGWVIHGHVHNNEPFLNFDTKRINVSAEVLNYKPININILESIIQ